MPVLEQVLEKYPMEVKLVFKNFPLQNHKFALKAAISALAADNLGQFWAFHDLLFKNYKQLNDQKIRDIARSLDFDEAKFEEMTKDSALQGRIRKDIIDGQRAGVKGTPTIFINGKLLRDKTLQGFQTAINKEMKKLDKEATNNDTSSK